MTVFALSLWENFSWGLTYFGQLTFIRNYTVKPQKFKLRFFEILIYSK